MSFLCADELADWRLEQLSASKEAAVVLEGNTSRPIHSSFINQNTGVKDLCDSGFENPLSVSNVKPF